MHHYLIPNYFNKFKNKYFESLLFYKTLNLVI